MATKYEVILRKFRQEPCVKISVVLRAWKYEQHKNFGKYNRCKNVITTGGQPKLEALYMLLVLEKVLIYCFESMCLITNISTKALIS